MEHIQVLDCTLRDGGYCNSCSFGGSNIEKIIDGLMEANLDIVEVGFLSQKAEAIDGVTKYPTIELASKRLPADRKGKLFVGLMNFGEFKAEDIPDISVVNAADEENISNSKMESSLLDGIRLAFHHKDFRDAMEFCQEIKKKGYLVFVQPMVSLSYSKEEFLELIELANQLEPYAFYLVDSFGKMKRKELLALLEMTQKNLKDTIRIGFHSHNNLQLAFANAQTLLDYQNGRDLIVDSTVFGMGRGAGNLNTELFLQYLNDEYEDARYEVRPLLRIIDEILNHFYMQNPWGYSLPNYLSAKYDIHPNYATYLQDKGTLLIENMDEIFSKMESEYRYEYDKAYIEGLYQNYMQGGVKHEEHLEELTEFLKGKKVLIVAPGISSYEERDKIAEFCKDASVVSISVNHDYKYMVTDYVFISNLRRFREIDSLRLEKCIVTSNVPGSDAYLQLNYEELLQNEEYVRDNSTLMLLTLLQKLGVQECYLAGVDGYSLNQKENYTPGTIYAEKTDAFITGFNLHMSNALRKLADQGVMGLQFLTSPKNVTMSAKD